MTELNYKSVERTLIKDARLIDYGKNENGSLLHSTHSNQFQMCQGLTCEIHNYKAFKTNVEEYLQVLGVGKEFVKQDIKIITS